MNIRRVGIIANTGKENAAQDSLELGEWLSKRDVTVFFEEEIAGVLHGVEGFPASELPGMSDMIVVFGGDGTLLRAARAVQGHDVPILGINLGAFGFMTVVNLHEMFDTMDLILKGEYGTSKRMLLDASVHGHHFSALNDAVINRGNLSRMVNLETFVDEKYLATFKADGLIISTPTGSTAYSLSTGGPIVFPELDSMIITPICPHTLTNRPIVVPPESSVRVVLFTREEGATVTLDGQDSLVMKSGDAVTITKSRHSIDLVVSPNRDYMEVLRGKLGWGGMP
ncbi:MAG: NAD(+)/NADH kinase [Syntrophales bacterium]|nr:NAD(+)/NADH kinase [Syntrophales bacterium]